jgi:DNA polymerase
MGLTASVKASPGKVFAAAATANPQISRMAPVSVFSAEKKSPSLSELSSSHQPSGESLDSIRTDLGDCRRCKLCSGRTNIVFGSGTSQTRLVFVGEGPGADEDAQGLPFVGAAGQLLTKIIEAIQLTRDQVYICNVVKCRPPSNRTPEEDEIAACSPFLFRQIESIRPQVICCLGAVAAQTVLGTKTAVGKLRGRFHDHRGIQVMPTWHPAYLLRNPAAKRDVWDDVKMIKALLDELG